jgi:hypothetical protein
MTARINTGGRKERRRKGIVGSVMRTPQANNQMPRIANAADEGQGKLSNV